MKTKSLACIAFVFVVGISRSIAAGQSADVTESHKTVVYGSSQSTHTLPAPTGTSIHDGQYLKTGVDSYAELTLPSTSITRLGANTIFNFSVAANEVDLQAGTILFCKPKDAKQQLNIKTAAVTAGIVGTTGFAQVQIDDKTKQPKLYQIGLIEGHVTVTLLSDGSKHDIKPGEIFTFVPGKGFMIVPFDVPLLTKTSLFFKKFKNKLPNQKYIDEEIAQYEDDVSRGFIKPDGGPIQPNTNYAGIPTIPTTAFDSAGNAQGGNSTPPPPSNSNR